MNWLKDVIVRRKKGVVKLLNAGNDWKTFTREEQEKAAGYFIKHVGDPSFQKEQFEEGENLQLPGVGDFFQIIARKANAAKEFQLAEKAWRVALKIEKSAEVRHEILTRLIDFYYRQRGDREDALDQCVRYCLEDIKQVHSMDVKDRELLSFKRLAIVYESEKKYREAIEVSEQALKRGVVDGTKGGYLKRIEKLKEKSS